MKKTTWQTYLFWIIFTEAVGGLAGFLTRQSTELYNTLIIQPPLAPPGIVFPIVWAILYALMGIGAARIYSAPSSAARTRSLVIYLLQLAVNFIWPIIFFNLQNFGLAFIWIILLWLLIIIMMVSFYKVDKIAAWLQLPYLLWVTFATYLNYGVWMLN